MDVSNEQVRQALLSLVAFVVAVSFHEFGHAWLADRLGDPTPRAQGRVSLSPMRHIDLLGTIIVPLMAAFAPGLPLIAWGKPVQTNPTLIGTRGPLSNRTGNLMVSLIGPFMNLILAFVGSLLVIGVARAGLIGPETGVTLIRFIVLLNLSLMFFNLLPIPPLDGGAILGFVLPGRARAVLPYLNRYGMLVLLLLFVVGGGAVLMRPAYRLAAVWGVAVMRFAGFDLA